MYVYKEVDRVEQEVLSQRLSVTMVCSGLKIFRGYKYNYMKCVTGRPVNVGTTLEMNSVENRLQSSCKCLFMCLCYGEFILCIYLPLRNLQSVHLSSHDATL